MANLEPIQLPVITAQNLFVKESAAVAKGEQLFQTATDGRFAIQRKPPSGFRPQVHRSAFECALTRLLSRGWH